MSRTLKQQLGLEKDPHAVEHISAGGYKLTRTMTAGGHEYDNQQPGLPVYHRRLGNPFPLFCIGIGAILIVFGVPLTHIRGLHSLQIVVPITLPLSVAVMTGAMFAFAEGNTFLANAAGTLSGIALAVGLLFLPWTGIQAAYVQAAAMEVPAGTPMASIIGLGTLGFLKAAGIAFLIAMIPIFIIFLASVKTAAPVSSAAILICIAFILQGVSGLQGLNENLSKAAGGIFIAIGCILFYSALTVLLAEEGINVLPVLPLPREPERSVGGSRD